MDNKATIIAGTDIKGTYVKIADDAAMPVSYTHLDVYKRQSRGFVFAIRIGTVSYTT